MFALPTAPFEPSSSPRCQESQAACGAAHNFITDPSCHLKPTISTVMLLCIAQIGIQHQRFLQSHWVHE